MADLPMDIPCWPTPLHSMKSKWPRLSSGNLSIRSCAKLTWANASARRARARRGSAPETRWHWCIRPTQLELWQRPKTLGRGQGRQTGRKNAWKSQNLPNQICQIRHIRDACRLADITMAVPGFTFVRPTGWFFLLVLPPSVVDSTIPNKKVKVRVKSSHLAVR